MRCARNAEKKPVIIIAAIKIDPLFLLPEFITGRKPEERLAERPYLLISGMGIGLGIGLL